MLTTELEPLFKVQSQPDERKAAVAVGLTMVNQWRRCISPCMTASLEAEPGLADLTTLLDQHLGALQQILACISSDIKCNDTAAARVMHWIVQAPSVTSNREVSFATEACCKSTIVAADSLR